MTDIALQNAERQRDELLERRNALKDELAAIEQRLRAADAFIYQWHAFAENHPVDNAAAVFATGSLTGMAARGIAGDVQVAVSNKRRNSKKEDVAAEARRVIEAEGKPVSRSDLYKELTARGFIMEGSDPEMVLSTMLWRAGEDAGLIRLRKGGGYWLKEVSWPDAGYDPVQISNLAELYSGEIDPSLVDEDEEPADGLLRGR